MDRFLSIDEAALYLGGFSVWTIRAWLTQGKLKRTKIGSRTMIRLSELDRFIAAGDESANNRLRALGLPSCKSVAALDELGKGAR